jgi:hypothetical protein
MRYSLIFTSLILALSFQTLKAGDLITDRPGFYNNPLTLSEGQLVGEIGIQTDFIDSDNYTISPALNTLKYGFTEGVELRLGIGWTVEKDYIPEIPTFDQEEIYRTSTYQSLSSLGLKLNLFKDDNDILSTELSFSLPPLDNKHNISPISNISLLYTRSIKEGWSFSSNLRYSYIYIGEFDNNIVDMHLAIEKAVNKEFGWLLESWTQFDNYDDYILSRDITVNRTDWISGLNLAFWYRPIPKLQFDIQAAPVYDLNRDFEIGNATFIYNLGASFLITE